MENIVRKGEIACNKQFLLFPQCFLPYMILIRDTFKVCRVSNKIMKLHDFLHRACIIIPLSNGVTVCGAQGPHARCAGYFQHMVNTL